MEDKCGKPLHPHRATPHARLGFASTLSRLPLAEDTGLIEPIGEWVLYRAFADAALWPPHLGLAVDPSPVQLESSKLVASVTAALPRSGVAAQRIELEITESVLLAENSVNVATLHPLRGLGVRISLDDFGVGYPSLSHLRSFPFKKLEIDRSFVRDIVGDREALAIVTAMATLSRSLGRVITAEGVETEEQFACLRELGCDEAQGCLISRPRPGHRYRGHARARTPADAGRRDRLSATRARRTNAACKRGEPGGPASVL